MSTTNQRPQQHWRTTWCAVAMCCLVSLTGLFGCGSIIGASEETDNDRIWVVDTRPYLESFDLSALPARKHELVFTVYVNKERKWTDQDSEQIKDAFQVRRLRPLALQVEFEVEVVPFEDNEDRARVSVRWSMGSEETWAVYFQKVGVVPATKSRLASVSLESPETLPEHASTFIPSRFIRTTGVCPHPVLGRHQFDSDGSFQSYKVLLSESAPDKTPEVVAAVDGDGPTLGNAPVAVGSAGNSIEIGLPSKLPGTSGLFAAVFDSGVGLAGRFSTDFTCEPADTEVRVVLPSQQVPITPPSFTAYSPVSAVDSFGLPKK